MAVISLNMLHFISLYGLLSKQNLLEFPFRHTAWYLKRGHNPAIIGMPRHWGMFHAEAQTAPSHCKNMTNSSPPSIYLSDYSRQERHGRQDETSIQVHVLSPRKPCGCLRSPSSSLSRRHVSSSASRQDTCCRHLVTGRPHGP